MTLDPQRIQEMPAYPNHTRLAALHEAVLSTEQNNGSWNTNEIVKRAVVFEDYLLHGNPLEIDSAPGGKTDD